VIRLLRTLADRISLYLPVILMGVLAFGTYWLVRSTPLLVSAEKPSPARHEPDYLMRQFSVKTFDASGRLKSEIVGKDARHFPDTGSLEIDQVKIRSMSPQGNRSNASANRAVTNRDASEVELFGNARVLREQAPDNTGQLQPSLEFRGEFLQTNVDKQRVMSNQPVQLTRGRDQFTADTMKFDNQERVLELKGRVKGTLAPLAVK
jgi:lipopolysaccharide export system protein LptC